MKKLLFVAIAVAGVAFLVRAGSRERSGRLGERIEAAIENCPPIVRMRRLEEQNEEIASLLREQNELLRQQTAAGRTPVGTPA